MVAEQLATIAKTESVPVFGIGPAAEMAEAAPGFRPSDFIADARSIICFGIPIPRDVFQTPAYGLEITWRSQNLLYRRLDTLALRFANLLEARGARAIPVYGCMPLGIDESGTVVGYVNQIRMAETAGIGTIGKNGLLVNSRFGSRLMLGGLLTTADLPSMRYPEDEPPACPPGCRICSDACPVGAIMPERRQVKIMRCLRHTARTPMMSRLKFLYLRARKPKAAARYMSITAFDEHTFHICSKCIAACPIDGPREGAVDRV
jgi:epoxyqueuosine reductase